MQNLDLTTLTPLISGPDVQEFSEEQVMSCLELCLSLGTLISNIG